MDMDPLSMEKAMLKNMFEKTGKNIEDWLFIINSNTFLISSPTFVRFFLCGRTYSEWLDVSFLYETDYRISIIEGNN